MRSALWMGSRSLSLLRLLFWVALSSLPLLWLLLHHLGHIPEFASRRLHHYHGHHNKNDNNTTDLPCPSSSPGTGRPERTHTLILTTFRSGSSFLGQLFNRHPDVFYLSEPAWHVWDARAVSTTAGIVETQAEVVSLLGSLFQCRAAALGPFLKLPPNRPRQFAKHHRERGEHDANGDKEPEPLMKLATLSQLFQFSESHALCAPPACNAKARPSPPPPPPPPARGTRRKRRGQAERRGEQESPPGSACIRACGGEGLELGVREACAARRHAVIKETRLVEMAPLRALLEEPALRLRVVHLVRDPRAVHLSRGRAFQDQDDDLSMLKIVCNANHNISMSMRGLGHTCAGHAGGAGPAAGDDSDDHDGEAGDGSWDAVAPALLRGRYALVRYEDLVQEPVVALRRLFRFVGIRGDRQVLSFALNMTRGAAVDAPSFSVRSRDALRVASRWRQEMSFESVSMVQQSCSSMMTSYGYRAMRSESEMREMKVTSTCPLGDGSSRLLCE